MIEILFYISVYVFLFISIFWIVTYFSISKEKKKSVYEKYPSLSIIVPVYNDEKNIEKTLISLTGQGYPRLKIIVVDDGSMDGTADKIKQMMKKYRNIKYVKQENRGKAAALNNGLKYVNTELFGFLDSDTFLSQGALKNMINYFYPDIACVTATIKPSESKTFLQRMQKVEYLISSFTRKLLSHIDSLYYTPAFAIYKTDVIKKLNGFDENNLTEDLEIGLRLKDNKYKIETSLDDCAYTVVPKSFRNLFKQRIRWYRGHISNTKKYKHMFFNSKFGDLGLLVLPLQYIILMLAIPLLFYGLYDVLSLIFMRTMDMFITNFDIGYMFSTLNFNILSPTTFFGVVLAAAFLFLVILSKRKIRENIKKIDYVFYIIFYPFVNLILWISAFIYEIKGAEKKW